MHRAFEEKFGIGIIETMGLTETRRAAASPTRSSRAQRKHRLGPGRALGMRGARHRRRDGAGCRTDRSARSMVRGANVMQGYYKDAEATRDDIRARRLAAHRRPRLSRRRRLLLRHRPHQGADHQGRREHRAARDRRGAARAPGGARGRGGRHARPRTTARRSWPASCCKPGARCTRGRAARVLRCSELGRYKTPQAHPLRRPNCRKGPSGKVQRLKLLET